MRQRPHDRHPLGDLLEHLGDVLDDVVGADEVEPAKPLYMALDTAAEGDRLTEEPEDVCWRSAGASTLRPGAPPSI